uniref:Uncharacterized protein n=1 Tax=Vibrio tasmaniensis TaxID=212663 RepID=A0A0H3ZZF8_9VIBR|nr:hypothetical protein [Vibrio tasmaniensis]
MKGSHLTQRLIEEGPCRMTKEGCRAVFFCLSLSIYFSIDLIIYFYT